MKKKFTEAYIEVILFEDDVIRTSGDVVTLPWVTLPEGEEEEEDD